ncbi:MAG: hypothetical protein ACI8QC_003006 [Planctomycetota bacterium]|jgi:hypothetical protein
MHPRRRTPFWSRKPARAALLVAPMFLFGAALAVVRKDDSRHSSPGSEALAPEVIRALAQSEPARPLRQSVANVAMQAQQQARTEVLEAVEDPAPVENLPPFAQRYLDWGAAQLLAEAAKLELRVQTLAQARCVQLLGTSEAVEDRAEAPAGVYARGDGKRYRLPESDHADLYGMLAEAEWLRQRAESL